MPQPQAFDCVVIGAGNGGLSAAAQLAAKGVKTLLLEQHNLPGGFATSFRRGRFEFEAALHEFADIGSPTEKGGVRTYLEDELGVHLDWVEVPEAFRLILTDPGHEMDITMPYGVEAYIDALERHVPGSREAVTRYVELCDEVGAAFNYLGQSRGNPDRKVLTSQYANFLKTCPYSMEQVANALRIPQRAKDILHAQWTYIGPSADRLNFTIYAAMMSKFIHYSAYIPRQRSHQFSSAVLARFRELGGEVRLNTRAEQVLVEDGRITGVVTSQGDRIATHHVISNASATSVYSRLIAPQEAVPELARRQCNARVQGLAGFVVYLGLDAPLHELGIDEYSIFVYANMDTAEMYQTFGRLAAPKVQAAMCLNNALPDCSPAGTSMITITTLFRPDVWSRVTPKDYVKTKSRIASDLIADLANATGAPLHDHIEEIEVATPLTFARYTGTHAGTIYGYEPEPWDSLIPRMMSMPADKVIQGLEFCGGYAFRCHGYSSSFMSGQTAALLTLRELNQEGR